MNATPEMMAANTARQPHRPQQHRDGLSDRQGLLRRLSPVRASHVPIEKNKITGFIGPSGCGKSTVLRSLNRMNDLIPIFRFEAR